MRKRPSKRNRKRLNSFNGWRTAIFTATNQAQYSEIITQLVDKYGLTRAKVIAEIEKVFSAMLSRWHKTNVVVVYGREGFCAMRFTPAGKEVVNQDVIDLSVMRGFPSLRRIIEKNLSLTSCLTEVGGGKKAENEIRWGEIIRKNNKGYLVEVEVIEGQILIAECPYSRIGSHERYLLIVGDRKAFHLRRINPILLHGVPRVKVILDRVSKNLVIGLFREKISGRFVCRKRFVGHKCFVESDRYIPKTVVKAVSDEIGEHIQVLLPRKTVNSQTAKGDE